ncbi:MAG: hypothetical protein HRU41_39230 [Saprospiraceae bacterium]|nr:hypothetical protein [Saprospiraceae bacterium]
MESFEVIVGAISTIVGVVGKSLWDKYGKYRKVNEIIDDAMNRTAKMAKQIIELQQEVMELKSQLLNQKNNDEKEAP